MENIEQTHKTKRSRKSAMWYGVQELPVSTLSLVLLFGVNLVLYAVFLVKQGARLATQDGSGDSNSNRVAGVTLTQSSILHLLSEFAVMSMIVLYAWVCEHRPIYPQADKTHDLDMFYFICFLLLFLAFGTIHRDPKLNDLVNRDQTEEWKGWMQVAFLLYHYYHLEEVYNAIRVFISCYVWMTGFGNFSFFYIKQDFGFVRFAQMMWRLNFTVIFLCLAMNNMYMLYYICPLHTFYFLVVYVVMVTYQSINHTKHKMRVKLAIAAIVLYIIWEFPKIFNLAFFLIPNDPHPGAAVGAYGIQYEWHFRSGLDHYSTYFGMLYALNFPQATKWMEKVESLEPSKRRVVKIIPGILLGFGAYYWATEIFPLHKLDFNGLNPYTFILPLSFYLYVRNCTPYLRQVHLGLFATIGKYTLETYLLQHHIWLTSNAKTLLVFIPNYPKLNMVATTIVYFFVAKRLYRATMVTRALLVPDDTARAMSGCGVFFFALGFAGTVAWIIDFLELGWFSVFVVIGILSLGTFIVLNRLINQNSKKHALESMETSYASFQPLFRFVGGIITCCVGLLILPSLIPVGSAPLNSGPLRPPKKHFTTEECIRTLFNGSWEGQDVVDCSSFHKEAKLCIGTNNAWFWNEKEAIGSCRFKEYNQQSGLAVLTNRPLVFVGDDSVGDIARTMVTFLQEGSQHSFEVNQVAQLTDTVSIVHHNKSNLDSIKASLPGVMHEGHNLILGAWFDDAGNGVSPEKYQEKWDEIASALMNLRLNSLFCVVVTPGFSADTNLREIATKFRFSLNNSKIAKLCKITMDLGQITESRPTLDGKRFSFDTNIVPVQLLLNSIDILQPEAVQMPQKENGSKTAGPKKGTGGGVAHSPTLGLVSLVVALVMLVTMDSYFGTTFIPYYMLGGPRITWEESTIALHKKLGIDAHEQYETVHKDTVIDNGGDEVDGQQELDEVAL